MLFISEQIGFGSCLYVGYGGVRCEAEVFLYIFLQKEVGDDPLQFYTWEPRGEDLRDTQFGNSFTHPGINKLQWGELLIHLIGLFQDLQDVSAVIYHVHFVIGLAGIAVITHLIALCRVPDFIKVLSDEDTSAPSKVLTVLNHLIELLLTNVLHDNHCTDSENVPKPII